MAHRQEQCKNLQDVLCYIYQNRYVAIISNFAQCNFMLFVQYFIQIIKGIRMITVTMVVTGGKVHVQGDDPLKWPQECRDMVDCTRVCNTTRCVCKPYECNKVKCQEAYFSQCTVQINEFLKCMPSHRMDNNGTIQIFSLLLSGLPCYTAQDSKVNCQA